MKEYCKKPTTTPKILRIMINTKCITNCLKKKRRMIRVTVIDRKEKMTRIRAPTVTDLERAPRGPRLNPAIAVKKN